LGPEIHELLEGGSVKCSSCDIGDAEGAKARAHLTGGAGGECERENSLRIDYSDINCIREAMRDCSSFSRASTGDNANWTTNCGCDSALFGIKSGKNLFC
jgi:hypothetical protein